MDKSNKILGILGGGQLGRMTAMAAARLGIQTHIYCPEANSPAVQVSAKSFTGDYEDRAELKRFAESVDYITYEFENIPLQTIRYLQGFRPVFPDDRLLAIAQDRSQEKQYLNDINIPTVPWTAVYNQADLAEALKKLQGDQFILKTSRFGYDGKGQVSFSRTDDIQSKFETLKTSETILEAKIDFSCEISVIVARDQKGRTALYGPVLNEHKNHILSRSTYPAPVSDEITEKARQMTLRLADAVELTGVLALEMFVTKDNKILANEIAPRPHNSGHWTIDACGISQFEQHVRTVCGLPVGHPQCRGKVEMINLLGEDILYLDEYYETPYAHIHLYGKQEIRSGRKMGHITFTNQ